MEIVLLQYPDLGMHVPFLNATFDKSDLLGTSAGLQLQSASWIYSGRLIDTKSTSTSKRSYNHLKARKNLSTLSSVGYFLRGDRITDQELL